MSTPRKTKAAKDIKAGDWIDFGSLAWQAGEITVNDEGDILIMWGNGSVTEYAPDERVTLWHQEETA